MNITVEIKAPELVAAINILASSLSGKVTTQITEHKHDTPAQPVQIQQPEPVQQQAPTAIPTAVPTAPMAPPVQQQPAPTSQSVPTYAPTYDMTQLQLAATQLMDAGKQSDLLQLFATFGIQYLMQLPQEQYGAFATKLRELGARI